MTNKKHFVSYAIVIATVATFIVISQGPNSAQQSLDRGEQISGTIQPSYDTAVLSNDQEEIGKIAVFHKYESSITKENYSEKGYLYTYGPCDLRWGFEPLTFTEDFINEKQILLVKGKLGSDQHICLYSKNSNGNLVVVSGKGDDPDTFIQIFSTSGFTQ